jgi:DNA-binding NarL/FixJ family response regulator
MAAINRPVSERVLVVHEQEESRGLICDALTSASYVTQQTASGREAITMARRERPKVVVLGVSLREICGYEVCRALRAEFGHDLSIIFVSGMRTESYDRVAGLLIGADDYLVEPFAPDELIARVEALVRRGAPRSSGTSELTTREQEVMSLLADGLTKAGIAGRLSISENTVGTHVEHIFAKLGVRNRVQAVAVAHRGQLAERPG